MTINKRSNRWVRAGGLACVAVYLRGAPSHAQSGVIVGTVYRDTADNALASVDITLGSTGVKAVTNYRGEFRFRELVAGTYILTFRHVGFDSLVDTVHVKNGVPIERDYVMSPRPVALDPVAINAEQKRYLSPGMQEFDERLRQHNGGYFVDDDQLRKADSRRLQDLLTSVFPGVRTYQPYPKTRPTAEYLSAGRAVCNGPIFQCKGPQPCPVTLYVNGNVYYTASSLDTLNTPDVNALKTSDYSGIEYYPGGASIPARYNGTMNQCGVLLLWTRDR